MNDDIKSRVTYSVVVQRLAPEDVTRFILAQLDRVALAHSTFTEDALALIVRASEGILRAARNSCLAALLEAVRDRVRSVDLPQVNRGILEGEDHLVALGGLGPVGGGELEDAVGGPGAAGRQSRSRR